MVGSQYKNIILWNLFFQKNYENLDSIAIAKDICKKLIKLEDDLAKKIRNYL